jgi:hypothetical protein
MKVFITGGSGYIGRAVIEALVRRDIEVTALVRSDASAGAVTDRGAAPVRGALTDLGVLRDAARLPSSRWPRSSTSGGPPSGCTSPSRSCPGRSRRWRTSSRSGCSRGTGAPGDELGRRTPGGTSPAARLSFSAASAVAVFADLGQTRRERRLTRPQSPGAPQTGNQRLRSLSTGRSAPTAARTWSSRALSRFSPDAGAKG